MSSSTIFTAEELERPGYEVLASLGFARPSDDRIAVHFEKVADLSPATRQ